MLVQLRWVLAAGGKVERAGFPIQGPLVVGSVLLGEHQTQQLSKELVITDLL